MAEPPSPCSRRAFLHVAGRALFAGAAMLSLAACGAAARPAAPGSAAAGAPSAAAAVERKLIVGQPAPNTIHTPIWLADALHAFTDRHVTVELHTVEGTLGPKALLAREIDVLLTSAASLITANLNGGTDLVYIGSVFNHSQYTLNVAPSVKSAADLKGKQVGTDQPGSSVDYQTRLLLGLLGLKTTDVVERRLGNTQVLLTALSSGQIEAAPMGLPDQFQAEARGFPILTNTYKVPYQSSGPIVVRSRIAELEPALMPFLEAYQVGIRAYYSQPDLALKLMRQYTKESDDSILQKTYDFYAREARFQDDMQPTMEGIQSMLDFLGDTSVPAAKTAKAEQFVDTRFLARLPHS